MLFREMPQGRKKSTFPRQMGQLARPSPEHYLPVAPSNALEGACDDTFFAPGSEKFLKVGGFVLHLNYLLKALAKDAA